MQILRRSYAACFFNLLRMGMKFLGGHMQAGPIKTKLPSLFLAASVALVLVTWVATLVYVGVRYS